MWFPRWHLCCQILLYHHDLQEGWCKRCLVLKAEETLWLHVIGTEPVNIRCMHLMHPVGSCVTDQPGQIKDKSKIRIWWYSKENCNDYGHKSHGTNEEVTKGGPMWYWGTNGCGFTQLCTGSLYSQRFYSTMHQAYVFGFQWFWRTTCYDQFYSVILPCYFKLCCSIPTNALTCYGSGLGRS